MPEIYDKVFKLSAGEDERGLFSLVTGVPMDADIHFRSLDRELTRRRLHVDQRYYVEDGPQPGFYIFEATTRFRREVYERCGRYGAEQALEEWQPVLPYFVVFVDEGFPAGPIPPAGAQLGRITIIAEPYIVKLWEVPPDAILEANRTRLLPWIVLLRSTFLEQKEAARRILAENDKELAARMATLASLRYGKNVEFFERLDEMLITREILEETPFYEWVMEEGTKRGMERGIQQGMQQGRLQGERRLFTELLSDLFGPMPEWATQRIDSADSDTLLGWTRRIRTAVSIQDVLK